jgi:hypothetical protein
MGEVAIMNREAFDAWCVRAGMENARWDEGRYVMLETRTAWEAWKAASASKDEQIRKLREALEGMVNSCRATEAYFIGPAMNREVARYFDALDIARKALKEES